MYDSNPRHNNPFRAGDRVVDTKGRSGTVTRSNNLYVHVLLDDEAEQPYGGEVAYFADIDVVQMLDFAAGRSAR